MEIQQYLRFYLPGWLFLMFFAVPLALTEQGQQFIGSLLTSKDATNAAFLLGVAGLIGGLPLGYMINEITMFVYNFLKWPWSEDPITGNRWKLFWGQESRGFGRLRDVRQFALRFTYQREHDYYQRPLPIAFHDYFWLRDAPQQLVEWLRRRLTIMHLSYHAACAWLLASVLSALIICLKNLGWDWPLLVPFWGLTFVVIALAFCNGCLARQEVAGMGMIWALRYRWRE